MDDEATTLGHGTVRSAAVEIMRNLDRPKNSDELDDRSGGDSASANALVRPPAAEEEERALGKKAEPASLPMGAESAHWKRGPFRLKM